MRFIYALAIFLVILMPGKSQTASEGASFHLQGIVVRRDQNAVLAVVHCNVMQIDTDKIDRQDIGPWLSEIGLLPPSPPMAPQGSLMVMLKNQQQNEREDLMRRSGEYEAALLKWAETGTMQKFKWTDYQKGFMHSIRRDKLFFVENSPTNLAAGKPFDIIVRKIGERTLTPATPRSPNSPPPPTPGLLNRKVDGKWILMVYAPSTNQ